jgi:excisionase family DNA binding protein
VSANVAPFALLTRQELADLLGVSIRTVDRLARRGVIAPVQLVQGGRVGFRLDDIERLIEGRSTVPAGEDTILAEADELAVEEVLVELERR